MVTELRLRRLLVGVSEEYLAELAGVEPMRLRQAEDGNLCLQVEEAERVQAALAIAAVEATVYPGLSPNLDQT